MKKVLGFLIDFQKKYFEWKLYLTLAFFLALSITLNYHLDFEDTYIDSVEGTPTHWLYMFLWQGVPFLMISLVISLFTPHKEWLRSSRFWLTFIIGFGICGFDRSFYFHEYPINHFLEGSDRYFIRHCVRWCSSLLVMVTPLLLLSRYFEPKEDRIYFGLANRKFDPRPYFTMLGIALVFIGIGSFFSDIQEYYPRYLRSSGPHFSHIHDFPAWISMGIYELCYGADFLGVEIFFRGFLVLAFYRFLGGYAVLAMISTYCFLHFGKPMPEAISSIFGGYILGIVSLYTRSIWGGVIIHVGIAWAMELFGYLHRLI
ncbi:CPBP family intramembrane glutamic endopeptidase [Marinoscillum sp. MHG1-6]|uniref:CPBP family intramembrane glutamic endopeptidase n=1 Tax=Marinoscillum sp. MHG1-6 TaxID=2959627 RepID=UPI002157D66B|nr:CPBP family intramembrane glutamic endopeptidase [Marinoscillum sp. MHG1-6]